jgi:hypothetical protein
MEKNKTMNIHEKLPLARVKLQNMNLKKNGRNKFAGFTYYELGDFLPEINKIFVELKLDSIFSINEARLAILTIVNAENPSETVTFSSPTADAQKKGCSPIQGIGAVHTYMRRYLYMNALNIVENDSLEAQAGTFVNEDANVDEIENIGNIQDLNSVYRKMENRKSGDTTWKRPLNEKAKSIGASFNQESRVFEVSAVA